MPDSAGKADPCIFQIGFEKGQSPLPWCPSILGSRRFVQRKAGKLDAGFCFPERLGYRWHSPFQSRHFCQKAHGFDNKLTLAQKDMPKKPFKFN